MAKIEEKAANIIYNVLVNLGGASERDRSGFIFHHTKDDGCNEWRFSGKLGFGGKYWSRTNDVTCYSEDETPERVVLIEKLNSALANCF